MKSKEHLVSLGKLYAMRAFVERCDREPAYEMAYHTVYEQTKNYLKKIGDSIADIYLDGFQKEERSFQNEICSR